MPPLSGTGRTVFPGRRTGLLPGRTAGITPLSYAGVFGWVGTSSLCMGLTTFFLFSNHILPSK